MCGHYPGRVLYGPGLVRQSCLSDFCSRAELQPLHDTGANLFFLSVHEVDGRRSPSVGKSVVCHKAME